MTTYTFRLTVFVEREVFNSVCTTIMDKNNVLGIRFNSPINVIHMGFSVVGNIRENTRMYELPKNTINETTRERRR